MTDSMLPLIRQMLEADGDGERAKILLSVPQRILLRWCERFGGCCVKARLEEGLDYLTLLLAADDATRVDGLLPPPLAAEIERARLALVAVARGGEAVGSRDVAEGGAS